MKSNPIDWIRVRTIGPSELFLGQIFDCFCENRFSPETCAIRTSFWGNPRSNSPWKREILELGLTLFLGSDSCPPDAHTNTHDNQSYLVRDSVACANQKCVLQLRCFWMWRTRFENHSKQMVRGLKYWKSWKICELWTTTPGQNRMVASPLRLLRGLALRGVTPTGTATPPPPGCKATPEIFHHIPWDWAHHVWRRHFLSNARTSTRSASRMSQYEVRAVSLWPHKHTANTELVWISPENRDIVLGA
jgi:hypothetical protein